MTRIMLHAELAGWLAFTIALLIVVAMPQHLWLALPLYAVAGSLFVVRIFEKRDRGNDG